MSTTKNENTPIAVSFDEWREMGPMGPRPSIGEAIFDNAEADSDYAGNDRRAPTRDYQAHLFIAGRDNPFLNPERTREAPENEAAWSMREHYLRVFARRNEDSLFLFNEFARAGNTMMRDAAAIARLDGSSRASDAEARQSLTDTGANAADTELLGDEIASRQSAGARAVAGGHYTVIASTASEARIIHGMIDYALKICPPDGEITNQKRLATVADLPPFADIKAALDEVSPPRFGQIDAEGRKIVGLFVSRGYEKTALDVIADLKDGFAIAPAPSPGLWRALINDTNSRGQKDKHRRVTLTDGSSKGKTAAQLREDNEKVVAGSDMILAVWDGNTDERDFVYRAIAQAARAGKLGKVVDTNGKDLDVYSVSDRALKDVPSARQWAQRRNQGVFDIPASSPEARLGLSLVRSQRSGAMNTQALDALGNTGLTVSELCEMASSRQGAKDLFNVHRVPPAAISALADERAMSNARSAFERIKQHCDNSGIRIVGPENYPMSLLTSRTSLPPVLFVKGGTPEGLRDMTGSIAIMGDPDTHPSMNQKASELVTGLDRPGVHTVQVESMGVPQYTPENPGILILASGHDQYELRGSLDWRNVSDDRMVSDGKDGRQYTIEALPDIGKVRLSVQDTKSAGSPSSIREIDWEGATLSTLVETPFDEPTKEDRARAALADAQLDTLKEVARNRETQQLEAPIKAFRDSFVENGGMVISAMAPVETNSVYKADEGVRIGIPASRSEASERQAARLAAGIADMTVIVNAGAKGPMTHAICALADAKRRPLVVEPSSKMDPEDTRIIGNHALLNGKPESLENAMRLPGGSIEKISNAFANHPRIGISVGTDMKRAAALISESILAEPEAKDRSASAPAERKTAEAVR